MAWFRSCETAPARRQAIGHRYGDSALLVVYNFGAVERVVNLLRSTGALAAREPEATFVARAVQTAAVDLSRLLIDRVNEANGTPWAYRTNGPKGFVR